MIYNGNEASDKKYIACQEILNNNIPDYSVCVGKTVNYRNSDITFSSEDKDEKLFLIGYQILLGCVRFLNVLLLQLDI